MFKYALQIIIGILTFMVATYITWYEGSALINNSIEWKYSTPFTKLFNIEITTGQDISQLDYFVYAVKFQPLFPTLMIVSILYILSVTGYYLIKSKSKWAIGFWGFIGFIMILFSSLTFNSSTTGGSVFFWITSISGPLFIAGAVLIWLIKFKYKGSDPNLIS
ncbi:YjdJ family protein [Solibacillus sp. A46]|uniref:YjdJ family protein n=1 Tax=Solibacillus faecavium TaxID=2762221 RepID=A0ABR8Y3P6_9BACL|nr:YjdJ family protein [Solibacillus faecavium]MBD8038824.1 YjdJ family protein [Solibacillus faecavium]